MSLYDDSMEALQLRLTDIQVQKATVDAQLTEINSRIEPLTQQKNDKQAQADALLTRITNLSNNIARLQTIIDADNAAAAAGLPLPSEQI